MLLRTTFLKPIAHEGTSMMPLSLVSTVSPGSVLDAGPSKPQHLKYEPEPRKGSRPVAFLNTPKLIVRRVMHMISFLLMELVGARRVERHPLSVLSKESFSQLRSLIATYGARALAGKAGA